MLQLLGSRFGDLSYLTSCNRRDDNDDTDVDDRDGDDEDDEGDDEDDEGTMMMTKMLVVSVTVAMMVIAKFQALYWFFLYKTSFHLHCNHLKKWSLRPVITLWGLSSPTAPTCRAVESGEIHQRTPLRRCSALPTRAAIPL